MISTSEETEDLQTDEVESASMLESREDRPSRELQAESTPEEEEVLEREEKGDEDDEVSEFNDVMGGDVVGTGNSQSFVATASL